MKKTKVITKLIAIILSILVVVLPLYASKIACHPSLEDFECSFQKTPFLFDYLHNDESLIIIVYKRNLFFKNLH